MNEKLRILYVEDEQELRENTTRSLTRLCDELFVAQDGEEGLELYKKHRPDIVVSDIRMPNLNGIEMAKAIKEINAKQHIIYTTAHSESSFFLEALEMQVDGYILKPIDYRLLKKKISAVKEQITIKREFLIQQILMHEITQLQNNILFVLDKKRSVIFSNQKFLEFFTIEDIATFNEKYGSVGQLFKKYSDSFHPKEDNDWIEYLKASKDERRRVVSLCNGSGDPHTFLISLKYIEASSHAIFVLTEITNITIEKNKFETKAYTDELTKVGNRAYFREAFVQEVERYRIEKRPLSLIILDIDKFKDFNDTYGHQVGDEILQELATTLKSHTKRVDCFARWGGEEFVIILPSTTLHDAQKFAEHLREIVERHHFIDNLKVTCSFGVAEFTKNETEESLMKRVDGALYRAKERGRNRVEV